MKELYHTYAKDGKYAEVFKTPQGWEVDLYTGDTLLETRAVHDKSEGYAEDVADNWVHGIIKLEKEICFLEDNLAVEQLYYPFEYQNKDQAYMRSEFSHGGSVVSFLMEHEHFSYPEAIKYLANKYGIEVEETERTDEQKEKATQKENLFIVSDYAKEYFHKTLLNVEEGKAIGLSYFKERGFTQETIEKFSLGYSLDKWDAFTNTAIKKGYQLEFLEKTGLTIVKGEKQFDRFKGRVIFPIQSMSGRTLGFGGRILTNDKKAAKYLNSPESDIYHKSDVLYGLYQAKSVISKEDNCYLVEGYTDVLQFNQSGIINVVSSSGTALTPNQIRLINRITKNITVLYDGDDAGLRASIRGIDLILEQGMNVKVCTFPEGEDPDSFAKNNSIEVLKEYLNENSKDFITFKANLLVKEADNDPIKKANTVHEIITSISKIPDDIKKEIYIQECSRLMNIEESTLYGSLAQKLKKRS